MTTEIAAFILAGGGDTTFFLAPLELLEWIESARPGTYILTPEQISQLRPFMDVELDALDTADILQEGIEATVGSCDNDIALHLSCICTQYDTFTEMQRACTQNDWLITREYHGSIY